MPPAGGYMQGGQTEGMAVASLITGLLSLPGHFCCYLGWPLGAVSIILGILAILKINKEPSRWSGKGMAIGGIISSSIGFLMILVVIVIYGAAIIFASP
jgi:hypothetical protein